MRPSLLLLWLLTGWCGSVPLILRIPRRPPVPPEPEPPPRPNWLILRIIGAVTGGIGGWVFTAAFGQGVPWINPVPWIDQGPHPEPWLMAVFAAATAVGAFIAARVVTDIYEQLSNRGR